MTTRALSDPRPARKQPALWPWLCLVPGAAFLLVFNYWPMIRMFVLSVQSTDLFGRPSGFVGLDNYTAMLGDPAFWRTMGITLVFTVGSVTTKLVLGLLIAIPLAARARGTAFARAVVLLPMAVSVAVAGLVFRTLFQPGFGLADQALASIGLSSPGWLTNPDFALVTVIIVDAWVGIGFTVLVLVAGLGSIPEEVMEAASLDGSGTWQRTRSVVLPLISPSIFFLMATQTIDAIREFTVINVLTEGGPANSTRTLVMDIWLQAFGAAGGNYGPASARAVVLLVLVAAIAAFQFGVLQRRVHYK
jgi:sn-glycerol 3-phosphate transport system permease protein